MRQLSLAAAALALSLGTATAAFAGDYEAFDQPAATTASTATREQVAAELQQARAAGQLKVFSSFYNGVNDFKSTKTRDDVKAELAQAQATGEFDVLNAEVVAFAPAVRKTAYATTLHAAK